MTQFGTSVAQSLFVALSVRSTHYLYRSTEFTILNGEDPILENDN